MYRMTNTPHYKLIYFDGRSRGEVIRWLFHFGDVPFEDFRIAFQDWPQHKQRMPFQQVPLLEIDEGREWIGQQRAISRYIAKRLGILGQTMEDQAKADMYVDGTADLQSALDTPARAFPQGKDVQQSLYDEFKTKQLIPFLDRYEGFLGKSDWILGSKISWADIFVAEILDRIVGLYDPKALDGHPLLKRLTENVKSIPTIAKHISSRPPALA